MRRRFAVEEAIPAGTVQGKKPRMTEGRRDRRRGNKRGGPTYLRASQGLHTAMEGGEHCRKKERGELGGGDLPLAKISSPSFSFGDGEKKTHQKGGAAGDPKELKVFKGGAGGRGGMKISQGVEEEGD